MLLFIFHIWIFLGPGFWDPNERTPPRTRSQEPEGVLELVAMRGGGGSGGGKPERGMPSGRVSVGADSHQHIPGKEQLGFIGSQLSQRPGRIEALSSADSPPSPLQGPGV